MKTEREIRAELVKIRLLLGRRRPEQLLFGAQQALGWVLGELRAPSDLEAALVEIEKELT